MWIVRISLARPYTFIVMALIILIATPVSLLRTPVDVLPDVNIPVISVVWSYNGLSAQEMGERITQIHERMLTTTVSDVEHVESQSLAGNAVIRIFFHPGVNIQTAIAQVVAISQSALGQLPPGASPPIIIKYTASSMPVMQLGLSSQQMSEQELFDSALSVARPQLATVPGATVPYPYGGKMSVISVDLDPKALADRALAASDVIRAIGVQNLILPSGAVKFGDTEYAVHTNASPATIADLNAIPVRTLAGVTTFLRDVAHVREGFSPQTNIIRQNGSNGMLLSIMKNGGASALDVINAAKARLPDVLAQLPHGVEVRTMSDQSRFLTTAISNVVQEACIATALTALLLLLFLGKWRTTVIIAVSIPLSIFSSLIGLHAIGETINLMTLSGLALAVGILVDDATVTVENIERHLHAGTPLQQAILDGAGEISVPALVSTLCICIVFMPMFFLDGVARYLFVPLAEAFLFAMLASYVLSRTLVPTLAFMLLGERRAAGHGLRALPARIHHRFTHRFEQLRQTYGVLLTGLLESPRRVILAFLLLCAVSAGLYAMLGRELFPEAAGQLIKLHMRGPTGQRIERMAAVTDNVSETVHRVIPEQDLEAVFFNIGLPYSAINLAYNNSGTIGSFDADVLISLKPGTRTGAAYSQRLIQQLHARFPGYEFFALPADIVTQILNFGKPAALDLQISGTKYRENFEYAAKLAARVRAVPGAADVRIQQRLDNPAIGLAMDRVRLQTMGLTPQDVAQNLLLPLSGNGQTAPSFWLNPKSRAIYNLQAQTEQSRISSMEDLLHLPVKPVVAASAISAESPQLLGNLVNTTPDTQYAVLSRYANRPVVNIYANAQGRDLAAVAADIRKIIDAEMAQRPKGAVVTLRGQIDILDTAFGQLGWGIAAAVVLVYLIIVINFQSWCDALIVVCTLPAIPAGIAWMMVLTDTNLSIPALIGAIMAVGIATANSILVVSFARQRLGDGATPHAAALEAGLTRLRPVLMTAIAMIAGMAPMAIGYGEGSAQTAPLARAVIGGLVFATMSSLLLVPVVFASLHQRLHSWRSKRRNNLRLAPDIPA